MEIAGLLLLLAVASCIKMDQDPDLPTPPPGANFLISRLPMPGHLEPMSELQVTDHVVNLRRGNSKSLSSVYVQTMRKISMTSLEEDSRLTVSSAHSAISCHSQLIQTLERDG